MQILIHNRGYEGSKPSPQDWVYMLEEDPSFAEYFEIVFNNYDIPELDGLHQKCLETHTWIWIYHFQEMEKVPIFPK